jgi:transposase
MNVTTVGLDLAKHVFQAHGIDAEGRVLFTKRLRRADVSAFFSTLPPCVIGMEACATAHHWARELETIGHHVRLMPPQYVKPYVKRNKNDAADAEAICEAVLRPTMRFVPVKTADQQAALMLHRVRQAFVRQRTSLITALRAHLAEFGIIAAQGIGNIVVLKQRLEDAGGTIPSLARESLDELVDQIESIWQRVRALDQKIAHAHRASEMCRRLATVPGIGPITATAIASTVADASAFRSGREFAAWLGLTPKQHSSGGKERMGRICKRGDRYIRHLLFVGARNVIRYQKARSAAGAKWIEDLLRRKPGRVAAIALANKMARVAWALMRHGGVFLSHATV